MFDIFWVLLIAKKYKLARFKIWSILSSFESHGSLGSGILNQIPGQQESTRQRNEIKDEFTKFHYTLGELDIEK